MGGDNRKELYDATGQVWLELFGEHVHVGYYEDAQRKGKSWQQAQFDHIKAFLDLAGVKQADQVVDLGCGYGGTAVHVAELLACKAVGVNISPFQVDVANKLAKRSGFPAEQVNFVVGDALAPALPDATYDVVLAIESSTYMPNKDKFVQQLARLVRPGGKVILVDFMRKAGPMTKPLARRMEGMDAIFATASNWKSAEDFKEMLAANGLSVVVDENWTKQVRGFWAVPIPSLLFRQSSPQETLHQRFIEGCLRSLRIGWLTATGGWKVFEMAWSLMSGSMSNCVQGGLDSGDLEYHVIVAKKP